MNRISLTSSMRSNLLSLQNISRQVSSTQNKLATGNKVNSAIDNPSSYYTARSLNNRADDLNALLDSMGQAVSTIKAATTALEAGADFLEQAAAVATSALETAAVPTKSFFEQQDGVVAVVSSWDELKAALDSGKTGNIVVYGHIEAQDTVTLKAGQNLVGVGYYGVAEPNVDKFSQLSFDLAGLGKDKGIIIENDNTTLSDLTIKANSRGSGGDWIVLLASSDNLLQNLDIRLSKNISSTNIMVGSYGGKASAEFRGVNTFSSDGSYGSIGLGLLSFTASGDTRLNFHLKGYYNYAFDNVDAVLNDRAEINIISDYRGLNNSRAVFNDNSKVNIQAVNEVGIACGEYTFNDSSQLNVEAYHVFWMNNDITLNINSADSKINFDYLEYFVFAGDKELSFNANVAGTSFILNGKEYLAASSVSTSVKGNDIPEGYDEIGDASFSLDLNWLEKQNASRTMEYDYHNSAAESSPQYAEIIKQYDNLIKDSSYKGINLLQSDKLSVKFNEDGSSDLTVKGKDVSASALGLKTSDWQSQGDIAQSLAEISAALKSIRSYSAELGNNYNIITSRQNFTENLINILTEGADKLTLADMNEESANMLALQTRQQLAVNSLSLASQASQAVLKLF